MPVTIEKQRDAQEAALQASLAWWEAHRPDGWDLRQHLDNPTVNATGAEADARLATAVAAAVEIGVI